MLWPLAVRKKKLLLPPLTRLLRLLLLRLKLRLRLLLRLLTLRLRLLLRLTLRLRLLTLRLRLPSSNRIRPIKKPTFGSAFFISRIFLTPHSRGR
ncbi:hypothetical protein Rmet_1071 [Cupriavidus metallidurans CH34]|uniref:Uncharacterized protein n=1 Tax=Cupriavidus metallidurans (strain ATCC 43123 / DSM 2839 / NBRC 102507 / CH34) TaxID=266264 RepID=Q1LPG9_CUPMC|nr:hypothetical protein Rmet_1071 [Cupriavidus metallidurans CH34]